jgi:hypothetical protein
VSLFQEAECLLVEGVGDLSLIKNGWPRLEIPDALLIHDAQKPLAPASKVIAGGRPDVWEMHLAFLNQPEIDVSVLGQLCSTQAFPVDLSLRGARDQKSQDQELGFHCLQTRACRPRGLCATSLETVATKSIPIDLPILMG